MGPWQGQAIVWQTKGPTQITCRLKDGTNQLDLNGRGRRLPVLAVIPQKVLAPGFICKFRACLTNSEDLF